jgi:hypothetical protein
LDSTDFFNDVCLQRLLEGMKGVIDCGGYEYLGSRPSSRMKNAMEKSLLFANRKMKFLDQAASRRRLDVEEEEKSKGKKKESSDLSSGGGSAVTRTGGAGTGDSGGGKKRTREEQKQEKIRRTNIEQLRKVRMRELERVLKLFKEEETHALALRRQAARIIIDEHAKEEEEKIISLQPKPTPPSCPSSSPSLSTCTLYPLGRPLHLSGVTFGRFLELWVFLFTYSKLLGIAVLPSQDSFEEKIASLDPFSRKLNHFIAKTSQLTPPAFSHFSWAPPVASAPPNGGIDLGAYRLLNKTGIALARPLLDEYYKIMGMDSFVTPPVTSNPTTAAAVAPSPSSVESSVGVPLNDLLWKEICRVVLLYTLCKSSNMTDYEATTCLKGKGYSVAGGDLQEKRIMKLIKRRISCRYHRQHLCSAAGSPPLLQQHSQFRCGLVVSVPTPSLFIPRHSSSSNSNILISLAELFYLLLFSASPSPSSLLTIRDLTLSLLTLFLQETANRNTTLEQIQTVLLSLQSSHSPPHPPQGSPSSLPSSIITSGSDSDPSARYYRELKSVLLFLIQKIFQNSGGFHFTSAKDIVKLSPPLVFQQAPSQAPIMASQGIEEDRWAWAVPSSEDLSEQTQALLSRLHLTQYTTTIPAPPAAVLQPQSASQLYHSLSQKSVTATAICRYNHEQHLLISSKFHGDGETQTEVEEMLLGTSSPMVTPDEKDEDLLDDISGPYPEDSLLESEEEQAAREATQVPSLSELSQRCFYVLKILMEHESSQQFNLPVDATAVPKYYGPSFYPHSLLLLSLRFYSLPSVPE